MTSAVPDVDAATVAALNVAEDGEDEATASARDTENEHRRKRYRENKILDNLVPPSDEMPPAKKSQSHEAQLAARRLKDRQRYASMTAEQRQAYNSKRREQYHRQSENSRVKRRERERTRYHSLNNDAAKERNARRARLERERYQRLSTEELEKKNRRRRERAAAARQRKNAAAAAANNVSTAAQAAAVVADVGERLQHQHQDTGVLNQVVEEHQQQHHHHTEVVPVQEHQQQQHVPLEVDQVVLKAEDGTVPAPAPEVAPAEIAAGVAAAAVQASVSAVPDAAMEAPVPDPPGEAVTEGEVTTHLPPVGNDTDMAPAGPVPAPETGDELVHV